MMDIEWKNLERVLNEFADRFMELARQNLDANGTNASRNLYDSFEKIVEIGEDWFKVSVSLADYWKYVENGRGPGKYPPPGVIRNWIEVKPVTPYAGVDGKVPSVEQLTFLISRKIAEEGTEPQPFFEPARERAVADYEERIGEAIAQDVRDYIQRLVDEEMKKAFGRK